tara:strand:- start:1184 stop:1360 length:177 start_codon:yes stop_codon:yes gene_type:complete
MIEVETIDCPECKGEGVATYERMIPQGFNTPIPELEEYKDNCDNCYGSGQIEPMEDDE